MANASNKNKRRVLTVVMDGVGVRKERFGNAFALAATPALDFLQQQALYTTLKASGPWVGLPFDTDAGNSEVGHNTIGAGRVFDQGAKLVDKAIKNGSLFQGAIWNQAIQQVQKNKSTLHFIGLLSDGNVHSHEEHLYALIRKACEIGIRRVRVHTLLDGRDVGAHSAEIYCARLEQVLIEVRKKGCDAQIASGGGRMLVTMDRYEADWRIVERGWNAHVLGKAEFSFPSLDDAIKTFRKDPSLNDQFLPAFVIVHDSQPVGTIEDGDSVILFNFRGDRALEITRAFEEKDFKPFNRIRHPKVFYCGMLEYDGDQHIPKNYLVSPPIINETLGEHVVGLGLRQFACSETQKYGHVTYFWNGNRSNAFDPKIEEYLEIPSDRIPFELKPWMKAYEITEATIQRMHASSFDCGRINYANGDMVGHSGDLEAAIIAMATVDQMIKRLILAAKKTETILLITADHGNCDEMFETNQSGPDSPPLWQRPRPKTSHTLAEVPCYIYDSLGLKRSIVPKGQASLANLANTTLDLMGEKTRSLYEPSLLN